jgi:hypothetical protein
MRTTIEFTDELFRQLRKKAADEGSTIRAVVEAALRVYLSGDSKPGSYKLRWRTEKGRLQPGVHLDDRDTLFDLMDGRK